MILDSLLAVLFLLNGPDVAAATLPSSIRGSNDEKEDESPLTARELISNGDYIVRKVAEVSLEDLDDEETIGRQGTSASGSQLTPYKGKLYFRSSNERTTKGIELYVYDEETDSIELVQDINPGFFSSFPSSLFVYEGKLYFAADDGQVGSELWVFDGSTASLEQDILVGSESSGPRSFIAFEDALCFVADYRANRNTFRRGIYCYDPEEKIGVRFVDDQQQIQSDLVEFKGKLYWTTSDELYSLDPETLAVTAEIANEFRPSGGNRPIVYKNKLFFSALTQTDGHELWAYDGSSAYQVKNIWYGIGSSFPQEFTLFDDKLYFVAADGRYGRELWYYDGSEADIAADIFPGRDGSEPTDLVVFNGVLYFSAFRPDVGRELFSFDGTTLALVADVIPGEEGSNPSDLTEFNDKLYFFASGFLYYFEKGALTPAPSRQPTTVAPVATEVPTPYPTPAPTKALTPTIAPVPTTPFPTRAPTTASPTALECIFDSGFVGTLMAGFQNFFAGGGN